MLVIRRTFFEMQLPFELEEHSPSLRRCKSDSLLSCGSGERSPSHCMATNECMEAATPTTCASVDGDSDSDSVASVGRCRSTAVIASQQISKSIVEDPLEDVTTKTTLMVRNLPTDLTQQVLVQQFVQKGYGGLFDFVYMPMNLRSQGSFGYAFINFTSPAVAADVLEDDSFSEFSIMWSTCQGLETNVQRYRNSPLMHASVPNDSKPAMYNHAGEQVEFPKPTKTIPKPRVHRCGSKAAEIEDKKA